MIKKTCYSCILPIILSCVLIPSCAKNHERALEKAVMAYRSGDKNSMEKIERELIQSAALFDTGDKNLQAGDALLYSRRKKKIDLLYPEKTSIAVPEMGENEYIASDKNHVAWSDGKSLVLHDRHAGRKKLITEAGPESPIMGLALYNDMVIYYMNYRLYSYDITREQEALLINDIFKPEYNKFYAVSFQRHNDLLVLCVGIAGSYNISIINPALSEAMVKNIKATSSRFHLDGSSLYYITGLSGSWRLTRYSIQNGKKNYLRSFSTITDLILLPAGCLFENGSGLHAAAYSGSEMRLPFQYTIVGKSGEMALLRFRERIFAVDSKKFFSTAENLGVKIPALFAP